MKKEGARTKEEEGRNGKITFFMPCVAWWEAYDPSGADMIQARDHASTKRPTSSSSDQWRPVRAKMMGRLMCYSRGESVMYVKWMWACTQTFRIFVKIQNYWAAGKKVKFVFLVCWESVLTKFYGESKKGWREGYIAKNVWWTSVLLIASRGRIPW